MKIIGIIPSRYASSRFPGKALVEINGKPMIWHVYKQAKKSSLLSDVIVATDDERIMNVIESLGGKVKLTSKEHRNGTERCAEVVQELNTDFIVNVQGDEPFIFPQQIDQLCAHLTLDIKIASIIRKIENIEQLKNNNIVKVVKDNANHALYFSRSTIPFTKNNNEIDLQKNIFWKHIGVYAYRKDVLLEIAKLPQGKLEIVESLEQLRWLESGYTINLIETDYQSKSIDTPDDLRVFINDAHNA